VPGVVVVIIVKPPGIFVAPQRKAAVIHASGIPRSPTNLVLNASRVLDVVVAKVTGEAIKPIANASVASFFMGFSEVKGLNAKNNNELILPRFLGRGNSKIQVNPKFVGIWSN
jgi:hypothetical protein